MNLVDKLEPRKKVPKTRNWLAKVEEQNDKETFLNVSQKSKIYNIKIRLEISSISFWDYPRDKYLTEIGLITPILTEGRGGKTAILIDLV